MNRSDTQSVQAQRKFRKEYQQPAFWIDSAELHFELAEDYTTVRSKLAMRRNLEHATPSAALVLDGAELDTQSVRVDGIELPESAYSLEPETLSIRELPDQFVLETEVRIRPQDNTSLMGLYQSSGNFCTQCEAEGFRKITWFLDRPDVMAKYTVSIIADKAKYPVLLSNGNCVEEQDLDEGRHMRRWEDPYPKPCYLFALVAGKLEKIDGVFTTQSGRDVRLEIYTEPKDIDKCEHALESLKKSMRWDEEVFGLEYDLDIFMIVAVHDFNMGAMENKGLNIFNSKLVLAKPETATDADYEQIEGVIAHEYFHNWTGNRVTCRDWFQLTLKEGLTVFRDQEFTADMTSRPVKRIDDVRILRLAQFAEDAGPMAHPIRPESYLEMNNFYTSTVYNKGAEVIRMYQALLGKEGFRKGIDLYFERHDGSAVTCDDFRAAMADANQRDLGQFERWYLQSGTPKVKAKGSYDETTGSYTLEVEQLPPTQLDGSEGQPYHMPMAVGLVLPDGSDAPLRLRGEKTATTGTRVLELREAKHRFVFEDLPSRPVPSLFRAFSAPVKLELERSDEELAFLMGNDSDAFQRWDAGQVLAQRLLLELCRKHAAGEELKLDPAFSEAWGQVLRDESLDGQIKAMALSLPAERVLAQAMSTVDPDGLHAARRFMIGALARAHEGELRAQWQRLAPRGPYSNDQQSVQRRSIANTVLALLARLEQDDTTALVAQQYENANNMTDKSAALGILVNLEGAARDKALAEFFESWKDEQLVLDKWFSAQASCSLPGAAARVRELSQHPSFTLRNPNRVRALIGAFAMGNQAGFHEKTGAGYELLADLVLELDDINPQVASRMLGAFLSWKRFDAARQELMQKQLKRIASKDGLSKNCRELVDRALEN
ncbi:MAG: aminopeptidase N [Planctomycetota bacterium]|nr:MAG: aminopeptidase N [Planctomycetota bacterium]